MEKKSDNDFKTIIITESMPKNCFEINDLINSHLSENSLIKRGAGKILKNYKNHLVALEDKKIIGTIGFKVWHGRQPEIIAFVVKKEYRGRGIGTNLLNACIQKIKQKNYKTILALTNSPSLFRKFNFKEADLDFFPEKIWQDCKNCPKNKKRFTVNKPECDEMALYLILD